PISGSCDRSSVSSSTGLKLGSGIKALNPPEVLSNVSNPMDASWSINTSCCHSPAGWHKKFSSRYFISLLVENLYNIHKIPRLQGGTANQAAINVLLSKEFSRVFWITTSAIYIAGFICCLLIEILCDLLPDECMYLLRLFWRRCQPGSDSPDRLICNYNLKKFFFRKMKHGFMKLF